jgi:hypothetical protein
MCTLTVIQSGDDCIITMNRDDLIERPEAPPCLITSNKVAIMAPLDLKAGGTWIGLNQHGLVACLLNRYDQAAPHNARSRGEIVPMALQAHTIDEAEQRLMSMDRDAFAPFTCVIMTLGRLIRIDWTGKRITRLCVPQAQRWMATSSSVSGDEVEAKRSYLFETTFGGNNTGADQIAGFHSVSHPVDRWWAPWMERPHAHTKSITQIVLNHHGPEIHYWDRASILERGLVDAPFRSMPQWRSPAPTV